MGPQVQSCALCGKTVNEAEPAIHGKRICRACRALILASEPRKVLSYAGGGLRRSRWLWVVAAVFVVSSLCTLLLLLAIQRAEAERARAEQLRAFMAAQAAVAVFQAQTPATQPGK